MASARGFNARDEAAAPARRPDEFEPGFTARSAWATVAAMTLGMLASTLNATTMNTSLAVIMAEYGVSAAQVQWVVTAYMLCLGIVTPLSAHLVARLRVRALFCGALGVFAAGALLGAAQRGFWLLVAARCVQAAGSGITIPTLQMVTFRVFPYRMRGTANGVANAAVGIGPAFGPVLAGALADTVGWRSIFLLTGALALASMALSWRLLGRLRDKPEGGRLDKPSFALSSASAAGIVLGCANLGAFGPASPLAWGPFAAGAALLAAFCRRELRVESPLLDLRALKCGPFALACGAVVLTQGWILASNSLVCLYAQDAMGVSATLSGLTMLPGALVAMAVSPLAGRALDLHGPRRPVTLGFALVIAATALMSGLEPSDPLWKPVLFQTVRFAGNSCLQQILTTWGISQLGRIAQGTAMANSVRQVGGSATNALFFSAMDLFMATGLAEGAAITSTFAVMNATQAGLAAVVLGLMYTEMRGAASRG